LKTNFIVLRFYEDLPVFKVGLGFGLDTRFELIVNKLNSSRGFVKVGLGFGLDKRFEIIENKCYIMTFMVYWDSVYARGSN
jgi:hypothetical protein